MDLSYTHEELAFRDEVRGWLAANLPADLADKVRLNRTLTKADMVRWHAILNSRGWLAVAWPREFGGPGWSAVQRHIFDEEMIMKIPAEQLTGVISTPEIKGPAI